MALPPTTAERLAHLDHIADSAWQQMDEARGTELFPHFRDAAFRAKDNADEFYRLATQGIDPT